MALTYLTLSPVLSQALQQIGGAEMSMTIEPYWSLIMLLFMVTGIIMVMIALLGWYKKFRYQNPQYANGALMKLIVGVIMINLNPFLTIMLNSIK